MTERIASACLASGLRERLARLKLGLLIAIAVIAAGCGGEDADLANPVQPDACADCGTALLTLTDAPGDFQSYTIDILSLELEKANGTLVQTLPATTRVDFAELVDLGEVLGARQIPAGTYVAARLRVDYSNAEIVVEDDAGGSLGVEPVDADGDALGQVELNVRLDARNHLVITPRRVSHLAFDLDLAASNSVDLVAREVTVTPFVLATVVPPDERRWRSRGRLLDVDTAAGTYTVQVRPFHHHQVENGEMTVHTTAATTWEINGVAYTGAAGLGQLDTLATDTLVVAFGTLDAQFTFTAVRVLAGTSADDLRREFLSGNVIARRGDTLVVAAVRLHWDRLDANDGDRDRHVGRFQRAPVTLLVGANTRVTRAGQGTGRLDTAAISVGQRVQAFGEVSRNDGGQLTMDATAGVVRLDYTRLTGVVTSSSAGRLTLDLTSIHGLRPARFDFAGTGQTPAQDADPDAYQIDVGALATGGHATGDAARVIGFVTPFGAAPPDFEAASLLDYTDTRASAAMTWPGGSSAPFSAWSASGITVDLGGEPAPVGVLSSGPIATRLQALPAGIMLAPLEGAGRSLYAIHHRGKWRIEAFGEFEAFARALDAALNGGDEAYRLTAAGSYDAASGRFPARHVLVVMGD